MKLPLPWIDIFVLAVLFFFIIRNAWIGFLRGLSSLAGLAAGYFVSLRYGGVIENILAPWFPHGWLKLASYALAFVLGFLLVFIAVEILVRLFKKAHLSWIDHLLGAILGGVKGILLLSLLFILLTTFYPQGESLFRGSYTYPYLMKGARFLADIFPSKIKSRFNYNLRRILDYEKKN
ncbi:MAG: CvpA family protein [Thermodesulfobacteria bacterium]|nr:CvpA family protein [Thermodesulfobacteriota bacterium]